MNKGFFRYLWLAGCVAAVLTTSAWADDPPVVMWMEVVDHNGSAPADSFEIWTEPGDVFTVELFLKDWAPYGGLAGYSFGFLPSSFDNGGEVWLELSPFDCIPGSHCSGSGDPCDTIEECPEGACDGVGPACHVNSDCSSGEVCVGAETCDPNCFGGTEPSYCRDGICANGLRCDIAGPACDDGSECVLDPEGLFCDCYASFFIDNTRDDYPFGSLGFANTDCQSSEALIGAYKAFAVVGAPGVEDEGGDYYMATIFVTDPGASGDFTMELNPDPARTCAKDAANYCMPLDSSPKILVHTGEVICEIVSSDPPNCEVDARQPHAHDNSSEEYGWESIDLTLTCLTSGLGTSDFTVKEVPLSMFPPGIEDVTPDGYNITLHLDRKISTEKWTCFALAAAPTDEVCIGYLPGDVNGSATSDADDIDALIAHLDAGDVEPYYSIDINHDDNVGPADILRVIDLFNGAADFKVWLGEFIGDFTVKPCPSE